MLVLLESIVLDVIVAVVVTSSLLLSLVVVLESFILDLQGIWILVNQILSCCAGMVKIRCLLIPVGQLLVS